MTRFRKLEQALRDFLLSTLIWFLKRPNSLFEISLLFDVPIYNGNLWDWDSFWAVYALFNLVDTEPTSSGEKGTNY